MVQRLARSRLLDGDPARVTRYVFCPFCLDILADVEQWLVTDPTNPTDYRRIVSAASYPCELLDSNPARHSTDEDDLCTVVTELTKAVDGTSPRLVLPQGRIQSASCRVLSQKLFRQIFNRDFSVELPWVHMMPETLFEAINESEAMGNIVLPNVLLERVSEASVVPIEEGTEREVRELKSRARIWRCCEAVLEQVGHL